MKMVKKLFIAQLYFAACVFGAAVPGNNAQVGMDPFQIEGSKKFLRDCGLIVEVKPVQEHSFAIRVLQPGHKIFPLNLPGEVFTEFKPMTRPEVLELINSVGSYRTEHPLNAAYMFIIEQSLVEATASMGSACVVQK